MASILHEYILYRRLASPLGIWGKLPGHGDFLRHNTTSAQAQGWQDWVSHVWNQRSAPQATQRHRASSRRGEPGWVSLEPREQATDLMDIPVAFVMQPGAMSFAPKHCVQGVVVSSCDQVGRACPLIIFQLVTPDWMRRTWGERRIAHAPEDMLYWLSRIAARMHVSEQSWEQLVHTVNSLWQLYQPTWRHLTGAPPPMPSSLQLDNVLRQFCANGKADAARGLKGVKRMPWANWPTPIVRITRLKHAFWQQDMHGGYVNASENLSTLWGMYP
jgi:type VI secretion system protein ImpM